MNPVVRGWRRWIPTDKWIGGVASGASSILASWVATGAFDDLERGMTATLIATAIPAYFLTNRDQK
jgi:hypothetical protein